MPSVGRLRTRPDFLKVAAAGAKWVAPGLILQARRRAASAAAGAGATAGRAPGEADQVRVGFTVSRKVGNAIRRNRARRRLRAVAAEVLPEFGRPGCDYVLIGRAGTLDRPYAELVQDLRTALERVEENRSRGRSRRARRPAEKNGQLDTGA
jgi:ribonuclease P protein component